VSRAADVFALGAIAFELVTARRVTGAGDEAVAGLPDIPGARRDALVDTFAFALATAPDERFTTALGFVASLKRALADSPMFAAPLAPPPAPAFESPAPAPSVAPVPSVPSPEEPLPVADAAAIGPAPPAAPEPHASPRSRSRAPKPKTAPARPALLAEPVAAGTEPAPANDAAPHGDAPAPIPIENLAFRPGTPVLEPEWERVEKEEFAARVPPPLRALRRGAPSAARLVVSLPLVASLLVAGGLVGLGLGWFFFRSGAPPAAPATAQSRPAEPDAAVQATAGSAVRPEARSSVGSGAAAQVAGPGTPAPDASNSVTSAAPPPAAQPPPPAPAAAAARPKPPVRGQLVVRSDPPGARVEVNGRARGHTPVSLRDLPLGALRIRVTREGYSAERRRVTLTSSRSSQTLDVPLSKTPARAAAPARPAAERAAGEFVGSIFVETRPVGARVFIDGREVGTSPIAVPGLRAGSHVVRLDLAGYKRWSASVSVVAGERNRVAASLEEEEVR
jgi:hypothetical protein